MWSNERTISAGDVVLIWSTRENIQPIVITLGAELNGRFGVYRHDDLLGLPYGSKVPSRTRHGFVHVLKPTPELWTLALPHRTQILYLADIAFVTSWLNIKPGSVVIEAGTGSGSFSHSVVRTVGTRGQLFSYDFHLPRVEKARVEFRRHGIEGIVQLEHRNVCKDGFTIVDRADAVFLDLPAPWDAVPHAKLALRKDRPSRICCYSPCIEQVLRTVTALNDAGFTEITMYETLLRPHQIHTQSQPTGPLSISTISSRLRDAEKKREERRLRQVRAGALKREAKEREKIEAKAKAKEGEGKRKRGEGDAAGTGEQDADGEPEPLRVKLDTGPEVLQDASSSDTPIVPDVDVDADMDMAPETQTPSTNPVHTDTPSSTSTSTSTPGPNGTNAPLPQPPPSAPKAGDSSNPRSDPAPALSKASYAVRGHTSYLTFAILLPERFCPSPSASVGVSGGSTATAGNATETIATIAPVPEPIPTVPTSTLDATTTPS